MMTQSQIEQAQAQIKSHLVKAIASEVISRIKSVGVFYYLFDVVEGNHGTRVKFEAYKLSDGTIMLASVPITPANGIPLGKLSLDVEKFCKSYSDLESFAQSVLEVVNISLDRQYHGNNRKTESKN